jgi:hypothetical protein
LAVGAGHHPTGRTGDKQAGPAVEWPGLPFPGCGAWVPGSDS